MIGHEIDSCYPVRFVSLAGITGFTVGGKLNAGKPVVRQANAAVIVAGAVAENQFFPAVQLVVKFYLRAVTSRFILLEIGMPGAAVTFDVFQVSAHPFFYGSVRSEERRVGNDCFSTCRFRG